MLAEKTKAVIERAILRGLLSEVTVRNSENISSSNPKKETSWKWLPSLLSRSYNHCQRCTSIIPSRVHLRRRKDFLFDGVYDLDTNIVGECF